MPPRLLLTTDDVQSDAGGVQVCGLARVVALVGLDCALDAVVRSAAGGKKDLT